MCLLAKSSLSIHSFVYPSIIPAANMSNVVRHCQRCVLTSCCCSLPNRKSASEKKNFCHIFIEVSCLLHFVKLCKMGCSADAEKETMDANTFISLRHCSTFHLFELEHYERKLKFNTPLVWRVFLFGLHSFGNILRDS